MTQYQKEMIGKMKREEQAVLCEMHKLTRYALPMDLLVGVGLGCAGATLTFLLGWNLPVVAWGVGILVFLSYTIWQGRRLWEEYQEEKQKLKNARLAVSAWEHHKPQPAFSLEGYLWSKGYSDEEVERRTGRGNS